MKHGWQFVKSIIPPRKARLLARLKHACTYALPMPCARREARRGTGRRWQQRRRGWGKKTVSDGVRIGDLLSKREEEFVLVDTAEKLSKHLADKDSPWPRAPISCRKSRAAHPRGMRYSERKGGWRSEDEVTERGTQAGRRRR